MLQYHCNDISSIISMVFSIGEKEKFKEECVDN